MFVRYFLISLKWSPLSKANSLVTYPKITDNHDRICVTEYAIQYSYNIFLLIIYTTIFNLRMFKIFLLLTSVNSNVGDRWRKVSHPIVSDCLNLLTRDKNL